MLHALAETKYNCQVSGVLVALHGLEIGFQDDFLYV